MTVGGKFDAVVFLSLENFSIAKVKFKKKNLVNIKNGYHFMNYSILSKQKA